MKYIILCGGIGKRCSGYSLPKPLNYVHGKHMIEHVIQNIPSSEIYIIYNIYLDKYNFQEIIINKFKEHTFHFSKVDYLTRGAVETAYVGIQSFDIPSDESIVFMDNDNMCTFSKEFIDNPMKNEFIGYGIDYTKTNYSFIVIDKDTNHITDIAEKVKISDNYCCGVYGFASVESFMMTAKEMLYKNSKTKNEFYFSQLYWNKIQNREVILSEGRMPSTTNSEGGKATGGVLPVLMESAIHIGSYDEITSQQSKVEKTPLRICFDLDNTLVTYPTVPGDYTSVKPISEMIQLLNKLKGEGHEIIIHTTRSVKTHATITIQTLEQYNIPYDELIFGKPMADIYVNDRAMNPYINHISQFGLFYDEPEFIPNKISNKINKNTIERKGDVIYKTGPIESMKGELFYYQNIPPQFSHYFPKLIGHTNIDDKIQLELEFINGIPLYYLYKNKLITEKMIHDLVDILHKFHSISDITSELIPIENVPMIHGDFGFSNIIMTYNDEYKLIDMRGHVDGILTIHGDKYDDYGKLYQSIMGYDLILNGETLDEEYMDLLKTIYLEKCKYMGVNLDYLFESY
jgi:choline kinase